VVEYPPHLAIAVHRKVLDVAGGSTNGGANIQQSHWSRSASQIWQIRKHDAGYYEVINDRSGKCLDVYQARKKTADSSNTSATATLINFGVLGWGAAFGGQGIRSPVDLEYGSG
jgi:hypothetical protein